MKKTTDTDAERAFIERVRRAWGRPGLSPSEEARFDAALEDRMARPRRRVPYFLGAAVTAAAAAAVVLFLSIDSRVGGRAPDAAGMGAPADVLGMIDEGSPDWDDVQRDYYTAWAWPEHYDADGAFNSLLSGEYRSIALTLAPPES